MLRLFLLIFFATIITKSEHVIGYINKNRSKGKETLLLHALFTVSERYVLYVTMFTLTTETCLILLVI
jgi:hypothetical protein